MLKKGFINYGLAAKRQPCLGQACLTLAGQGMLPITAIAGL